MKKTLDAFGYNAEEFEDWWKESIKKMIKRAKRHKTIPGIQVSSAQKQSSRKSSRRPPRDMSVES